jgi:hypothetical protein
MTTAKWANTENDEGALPVLLQRMEKYLPADSLDALWIFPTRRAGSAESTVVVAACRDPEDDRRLVYTAHFTVLRDRKGRATVEERLQEHARAPAEALSRVVAGVVRRLGDEAAHPPRHEAIDGEVAAFDALIRALGGRPAERGEKGGAVEGSGQPAGDRAAETSLPEAEG